MVSVDEDPPGLPGATGRLTKSHVLPLFTRYEVTERVRLPDRAPTHIQRTHRMAVTYARRRLVPNEFQFYTCGGTNGTRSTRTRAACALAHRLLYKTVKMVSEASRSRSTSVEFRLNVHVPPNA